MGFRRDHPLLRGCRFLWIATSVDDARNLLGPGPDGTVSSAAAARVGRRDALAWSATGGVTWDAGTKYGLKSGGFTVITKCRIDGNNGTAGQLSGLVSCKDGNGTTSTSGFGLGWIKDTFTNPGFNMWMYRTGGYYYANSYPSDATDVVTGVDHVVAGVFDPKTNGPKIYVDGVDKTNLGSSVGSPETLAWSAANGDPLVFCDIEHESSPLNGALAWVAMFDRALSQAEIVEWGRDAWAFLGLAADPDLIPAGVDTVTYRNAVIVGSPYTPLGPVTYRTGVDALGYVSGDLTADPSLDGPVTLRNEVRVSQSYAGGQPTLALYKNRVIVGAALTPRSAVTYRNRVRVGQRAVGRIDGRIDLIGTARYRR